MVDPHTLRTALFIFGCVLMLAGFLYEIIYGFRRRDDIVSAIVFWPGYFVAIATGGMAIFHG